MSLPSTKTNWQLDQFIRSVPESAAPAPAANAAPAVPPAPVPSRLAPTPASNANFRLLSYKAQAAAPAAVPTPVAPAVASVPVVAPPPTIQIMPPAPAPIPAPPPVAPTPAVVVPAMYTAMVDQTIMQAESELAAFEAAMNLLMAQVERRHKMPEVDPVFNDHSPAEEPSKPEAPADKPDAPKPPKPEKPAADNSALERLKNLSPAELARLGRENKKEFFAVLRPAAEEAERKYGVPAAITLAQAALETGWGAHIIPGFNLFGIKGTGPAGTVRKGTWEVYGGKTVTITANFAKYHDFYEGVLFHGKLFHNGYYDKAMAQYKKDKDPFAFARNITGTYATDPAYGSKLSSIMRQYNLV